MADPLAENINSGIALAFTKATLAEVAERPSSRILNLDTITDEDVENYLRSKHCALWGDFMVSSTMGMEKAKAWFQKEISDFYSYLAVSRLERD